MEKMELKEYESRGKGGVGKGVAMGVCLETGKLGVGITLLVLLLIMNQNTYSLMKCVALQMSSLTALSTADNCLDHKGDAVRLRLCHTPNSTQRRKKRRKSHANSCE